MINTIEDLPVSNYTDRYGKEILEKTLRSPEYLRKVEMDWTLANSEWITFTSTVTFKKLLGYESSNSMEKATLYEYNKPVLNKIKKRLCRSQIQWKNVLPIHVVKYEYEQGSFFKPVPKSNSPHHIHGLISVKRSCAYRIFNFWTREIDPRLSKDLRSILTVSTFMIEPLRTYEAQDWINYIYKGKSDEPSYLG